MLKKQFKKTVIVGAGVAGRDVLKEILADSGLMLNVVGFIDDDPSKKDLVIEGISIIGRGQDLKKILKEKRIQEVIIAIPSAEGSAIARYLKICSNARVACRIVPRVKEIIEGKAHIKSLREVRVEDLLGRPVVKADVKALHEYFKGKSVLITGAAGSIGSELARQVAAYKPDTLVLLDWWENGLFALEQELIQLYPRLVTKFEIANIQEAKKIARLFAAHKPDYIFHAAAYKHVPLMELHPDEAVKNNIIGTFNLSQAAKKQNASTFILISTDKAAHPISVMGATKLVTEGIGKVQNGSTKFIAVRFGNVLDSHGSVIPTFKKQIAAGGPVTVTDKRMTRYFMTIPEACQLILKAAHMGEGGELFVLDMGEPVKIIDLAENLIRLSGYIPEKDIKIIFSGKRPGEKLHEKLLNHSETLQETSDPRIRKTESLGFDIALLPGALSRFKSLARVGDNKGIRKELSRLILSFKSR